MEHGGTCNLRAEKVLEEEEKTMQKEGKRKRETIPGKKNPRGAVEGSRALPSPLQSPAEALGNSGVQKGLAWTPAKPGLSPRALRRAACGPWLSPAQALGLSRGQPADPG